MSFPRYESYKDSGVEWLGEVPEHWEITKTKHVTKFHTGWTPPTGKNESYEGENLWANISDLGEKLLFDTAKRISDEAIASSRITPSPKGSLLFSFKLSIGQVSFAGKDMYTNEAIATFLASANIDGMYAYYAFPFFLVKNAAENIYGAKLLNQELIRAATLALPRLKEQSTIATFLDRETAKIDALIAEQQRLIELLKEKRQAVISHAVTKGMTNLPGANLNAGVSDGGPKGERRDSASSPDTTMKDSGIEWLGEVPEHWESCHLKRMTKKVTDGAHISPETENGVYEFVSTKDVRDDGIDFENCLRTSEGSYDYLVRTGCKPSPGDVLFSKDGTIGRTVVVRENRDFVVASSLIIIKPDTEAITPDFLNYLCQSSVVVGQVESFVKGAGLPRLSIQNLLKIVGVFPPIAEQRQIVDRLNIILGQMASLLTSALEAIELLKERRTALISAFVTGKIDVRGLVFSDGK